MSAPSGPPPPNPKRRSRAKAAKKKAEPTEYVVLERITAQALMEMVGGKHVSANPDPDLWREVDRVTTHGNEKTIVEKWANGKGRGGIFKLCPARSWKGGVKLFEQTRMTAEALS